MQTELFPAYPRLPAPPPAEVIDYAQAWKQFEYPFDDLNAMPQSIEQSDITTYLKVVLEAIMAHLHKDYLVSDDIYVHYSHLKKGKMVQDKKAPDVFIATPVLPAERKSFIKEAELELLGDRAAELRMIAIEVLSDSNYADKQDQPKRLFFYDGLGVEEYIVVHTKPTLSLEVFWRINGVLQRTLFYENYKIEMLNVHFEIEVIEATETSPKMEKLHLVAPDGTRFGNYASQLEMQKQAKETLQTVQVQLKEYQEEAQTAEEARKEAEKRAIEAEEEIKAEKEARKEAEKRAKEAEESARKALFELEELRNLLKVQKDYK